MADELIAWLKQQPFMQRFVSPPCVCPRTKAKKVAGLPRVVLPWFDEFSA